MNNKMKSKIIIGLLVGLAALGLISGVIYKITHPILGGERTAISTGGGGSGSGNITAGSINQVPYYTANSTTTVAASTVVINPANNYLGLGTTTPSAPLSINSTGYGSTSSPLFLIASSTNITVPGLWMGNSGVGNSLRICSGCNDPQVTFEIVGGANNGQPIASIRESTYSNTAGNASVQALVRAHGTRSAPTIVANGDTVGAFSWFAEDDTPTILSAGQITGIIDGTPATGIVPLKLSFNVADPITGTLTNAMTIRSNQMIGIGTTTPQSVLTVAGTVTMSGLNTSTAGNSVCKLTDNTIVSSGGTTCPTSFIQSKKDISEISSQQAHDTIMGLKPVQFTNIEGGDSRYGFIANWTQDSKLVEYAAADTTYKTLGVTIKKGEPIDFDYTRGWAVLTMVVQDQQKTIDSLEARVEALENK